MSKGIDALNNLLLEISEVVIDEKTMLPGFKLPQHQCERIEIIKKELRALDIIKEKSVDTYRIKMLDFELFNQLQISCRLPKLTQEEYDLLKEVL